MLFWVLIGYSQDTSFVKSAYGGSSITVPAGVTWQVDRVFVNNGTGYNIKLEMPTLNPAIPQVKKSLFRSI